MAIEERRIKLTKDWQLISTVDFTSVNDSEWEARWTIGSTDNPADVATNLGAPLMKNEVLQSDIIGAFYFIRGSRGDLIVMDEA